MRYEDLAHLLTFWRFGTPVNISIFTENSIKIEIAFDHIFKYFGKSAKLFDPLHLNSIEDGMFRVTHGISASRTHKKYKQIKSNWRWLSSNNDWMQDLRGVWVTWNINAHIEVLLIYDICICYMVVVNVYVTLVYEWCVHTHTHSRDCRYMYSFHMHSYHSLRLHTPEIFYLWFYEQFYSAGRKMDFSRQKVLLSKITHHSQKVTRHFLIVKFLDVCVIWSMFCKIYVIWSQ